MHVTAAMVLSLVALTVTSASGKTARDKIRQQRQIVRILNDANAAVRAADKGCGYPRPDLGGPQSFTDDAPSEALLNTLGILRRPATDEETRLAKDRGAGGLFGARDVYRNYIRVARSASGRRFVITAARDINVFSPRPARCLPKLRAQFIELLAGKPRAFREAAKRVLRQAIRQERHVPRGPREGVFLSDGGGGGGGAGAADIRRRGMFFSAGRRGRPTLLSGLIPDGVETIRAEFAGTVSRGALHPPRRFARAITRTVTVRDNVVSFPVRRPAPYAFPTRMIWRDADGELVRVVTVP